MTKPESESIEEAREMLSPVRFFNTRLEASTFDRDYTPRVVETGDADPNTPGAEVNDAPKANEGYPLSSVAGSVESYSDLIPAPEDLSVPAERGSPQLPQELIEPLLPQDSFKEMSPGDEMPPVETSPSSPELIPSSPNGAKSNLPTTPR